MTTPLPCPRCGNPVEVELGGIGYVIDCGNCYGYCTELGHDSEVGLGFSESDAIADWNDQVESFLDAEAHEIAEELHPIERRVLMHLEWPVSWGAAVGVARESLCGMGLLSRGDFFRTGLGDRVAAALRESEQEKVKS